MLRTPWVGRASCKHPPQLLPNRVARSSCRVTTAYASTSPGNDRPASKQQHPHGHKIEGSNDGAADGAASKKRASRRFSRRSRARLASRRCPSLSPVSDEDILQLNVGGRSMLTARSTLLQVPGSVLHEMFCCENQHRLTRNRQGEIFLDFEAHMFGLVLRFMRELKMSGGTADTSLSSFRAEDRTHLLLLLKHLRLLPPAAAEPQGDGNKRQRHNRKRHNAAASEAPQHKAQQQPVKQHAEGLEQQQQGGDHRGAKRRWRRESVQRASLQQEEAKGQAKRREKQLVASPVSTSASASTSAEAGLAKDAVPSPGGSPGDGLPRGAGASPAAAFSGTEQHGMKLVPKPVPRPTSSSQLYFIQAQYEQRRGIKVSVYTESDLPSLSDTEPFDIFCDTTATDGSLSFTYVCREDFDNVFLGITTRNHTDRKGAQIPCFGWKSHGCIYSGPEARSAGVGDSGLPSCAPSMLPVGPLVHEPAGSVHVEHVPGRERRTPLWGKGDSVELLVSLGDAMHEPSMVLKVNGVELDHISHLPPLRSSWSWYLALYMGGDMSAVTLMSDNYAVFWGDYQVKRFL